MWKLTIFSCAGATVSWKELKTYPTSLEKVFPWNVFADISTDRNVFADMSKDNMKIRKMLFINAANVWRCFSAAANNQKS